MTQKLIQDRYQAVLDRIQKHSPEGKQPQLVAVSKTVGADQIQALYDNGVEEYLIWNATGDYSRDAKFKITE